MNNGEKKTWLVELFFTPGPKGRPLAENLVRGEGLTVDLRRARVTSRDAWLELKVSGTQEAVDAFVRRRKNEFTVVTPALGNVA